MNHLRNALILLSLTTFSSNVSGQEMFGNVGFELAMPMGDWSKDVLTVGVGGSGGAELTLLNRLGITGNLGLIIFGLNADYKNVAKSYTAIPLQFGAKYYFAEHRKGLYVHGEMGVHFISVESKDINFGGNSEEGERNTERYFSIAPQIGYFFSESISASIRYQLFYITEDEELLREKTTASMLGLKLAYNF